MFKNSTLFGTILPLVKTAPNVRDNEIDIEVQLLDQNQYLEISFISNTREFQARRAKIRYKYGKKNSFVNTLNATSLAVGRTLVVIMENYQKEDGSIDIPEVLKPCLGM